MDEALSDARPRDLLGDKFSLSEFSKWNNLRVIGGSTIAKASVAVPIFGYLILFNQQVIDYLRLHSDFCADCSVSWRLYFFYFGCCAFAIGSLLYALLCPVGIERHAGAHDFYEAEKEYYANKEHRRFLADNITKARQRTYIDARYMYPFRMLSELESWPTTELMGEYYFLENRSRRLWRITILISYIIGGVLLMVPTAGTFTQVLIRGLGMLFRWLNAYV